jgi:transcriptional regulator with XRE-family HTH domain
MVQMNHRRTFKELGDYLTELVGNKLRNKQIADAIGISESAISQWFSGQKHPEQEHLHKACGLLRATFEDVEKAFALAGYYLSPEEIAQAKAWQPSDEQSPALETYNDLTSWLSAIRGSKSGIALEAGLPSANRLVKRIQQHIKEEGAKTRLLFLYFDALDELTQLQNLLTPPENLKYADLPFYCEMQRICEATKDQRLHARLLASQGDEDYVLGRHGASYRTLKDIIDPSVVEPELYIRPILRSSCLDLSYPQVGSDADFQHVSNLLEAAIDKYATTINPMLIVLGLEGLSRAYAMRYEHTRKLEYKKQALQKLEDAEALMNRSAGYPIFGLRVRKARLRLALLGVLDGLSLADLAALAREIKKLFEGLGDFRSTKDIKDILVKIKRSEGKTAERLGG